MIKIGKDTRISDNATIYPDVEIGTNCRIYHNVVIREGCRIGNNVLIASGVTLNKNVTIGNNVKVMDNTHLTGGMIIEDNIFISCLVATTNDNTMGRRDGKPCVAPRICTGAKIGAGANILPGITVGRYAIVGAGSVVTHDVCDYTKVMGVPARKVPQEFRG